MSSRSVAMLPSFYPNQGLWCKLTSGQVADCLAGYTLLPIIFNISNGYANSSNEISTTYTAQKQIS